MKKEWDFIVKETHEGDRKNRIRRELLFIMEGELSKSKPNICFYNKLKNIYLKEECLLKNNAYEAYADILNGSVD
ncbi:MAG: hypothetical protein FWF51_04730 [Chitinivibrionia bacterium]|nr:hypothetical protein [Chitinivibrionia bacterium]